jgi:hypothetical protein
MEFMVRVAIFLLIAVPGTLALAQTPQPFPRPGESRPAARQPQAPEPIKPIAPQPQPTIQSRQAAPAATDPSSGPTQEQLGLPIYPAAQFLSSFDAGRGQRYFIYGATATFGEIVEYYKTYLDKGGEQVFREPPTHMFEVGRFREESMAFPPGITVKDWTWGGSQGYPNPKLGAQPARFRTVIMIVPSPATPATAR